MSTLSVENAKIGYRNFAGKEGKFNPAGRRNFCVFFETDVANKLQEDGWNIKWLVPKNPDEEKQAYLQVSVEYGHYPPKIVLITKKNKTILQEDDVKVLDYAEIEHVDLTIRPYNWEVNKKKGVKAYLKTMYVTIIEDEFAEKYRNVPDSAVSSSSYEDAPF